MAVQGLEQTRTKIDAVKRMGGWVMIAIVFAVIVVAILILSGLMRAFPLPPIHVMGFTLPETWVFFIASFSVAMIVILSYVYLLMLIKSSLKRVHKYWMKLPAWAQNAFLAFQAAFIAGMGMFVTHLYYFRFTIIEMVAPAIAVFVLVFLVTRRFREEGWTIMEWTKALYMSALIGIVVGTLATFAFAEVGPGYMPPAVLFGAWAFGIYLFYRRKGGAPDDFITRLLTQTGYAQMRQVDTFSVSILSGLIAGVVIGGVVGVIGTHPSNMVTRIAVSIVLVWPVVTLGTSLGWPSKNRHGLVITDINVRKSTDIRELTVRNVGDQPVNIYNAKLQDAHDKLYHIGIRATLSSGESGKFELPPEFELAAHDRYDLFSLPFGLTVMRDASPSALVTRDGKNFVLLWIDEVESMQESSAQATETGATTA